MGRALALSVRSGDPSCGRLALGLLLMTCKDCEQDFIAEHPTRLHQSVTMLSQMIGPAAVTPSVQQANVTTRKNIVPVPGIVSQDLPRAVNAIAMAQGFPDKPPDGALGMPVQVQSSVRTILRCVKLHEFSVMIL